MSKTGRNLFWQFWGKSPNRKVKKKFHDPKELIFLGRAVRIEYLSDKKHGTRYPGEKAVYYHDFTSPVALCMDEKAGGQLYLMGKKIKVTENGIEN